MLDKDIPMLLKSKEIGLDVQRIDPKTLGLDLLAVPCIIASSSGKELIQQVTGQGGDLATVEREVPFSLLTKKEPTDEDIAAACADAPGLVREILNEVKAGGIGDDKNILIELNIEQTRHNEIQLLGNGEWCIALGGRDCSLQMHEQKLLEISVTQESLALEIEKANQAGLPKQVAALESDLTVLKRMEAESERFGEAVGLDSASTFECIVDGDRHFSAVTRRP